MSDASSPVGVLLVQLGTPASPKVRDVRAYLREFLSDPRVIDIPAAARWLLLRAIILPFRSPRSAAAYASIWTEQGSPLLVHSRALAEAVAKELGPGFRVELGMRYGEPSLGDAIARLTEAGARPVVTLPLFPQYAESSTGSALARTRELADSELELRPIRHFYADPGFIGAQAELTRPLLDAFQPDHVLLSYHGLPERQVKRTDLTGTHCFASEGCCDAIVAANRDCYRAHCFATSRALVEALGIPADRASTSFQSRLGRTPWIQPYTDLMLPELAERGVRRLAILCPSFVADCLETVEEIGIRARDQWRELGGEELCLVPCVNSSPAWVTAAARLVREAAS